MTMRKIGTLVILFVFLCLAACTVQAETMTLAFGYEIDVPEGVEITKEEWTPENLKHIYRIDGTYENGKEEFFVIWCDSNNRPNAAISAKYIDGFNIMSDRLWGSLVATSDIGGQNYESDQFQMLANQMEEFASHIENALANNGTYQGQIDQLTFKKLTPVTLDSTATFDEGQLDIQSNMKAEYGNEKLVVTDESGRTILWLSMLPRISIAYYQSAEDRMLDNMILNMAGALEAAGLNTENYDLTKETLEKNAWKGSRAEYCITAPEKNGEGFAILKVFSSGSEIVVYEGGSSWDEAMAMAYSAVIFFKEGTFEKNIIPGVLNTVTEDAVKFTLPVGKNQFVIDIAEYREGFGNVNLECRETEYEEGLQTAWGYVNEHGMFTEVLVYQYLPMPEEFQANTVILTDDEYLSQIEEALAYIGEKYLDKLQAAFTLESGTPWTKENVRTYAPQIIEMIEDQIWQPMDSYETYFALRDALAVAGYFAPIDREKVSAQHLAWNAGGRRWVSTKYSDLFGNNSIQGNSGAIALFDGALHLIETSSCEYATSTFRRNDGSITSAINQTSNNIAEAKATGKQTAVVATKSSPLTLRETPDKNGAKILTIPKGETVFVIQEGDWALIEYNGKQGYVDGKYLK